MKRLVTIFILTCLFVSCSDNQKVKRTKEKLLDKGNPVRPEGRAYEVDTTTFNYYWRNLHKALVQRDTAMIRQGIRFPFMFDSERIMKENYKRVISLLLDPCMTNPIRETKRSDIVLKSNYVLQNKSYNRVYQLLLHGNCGEDEFGTIDWSLFLYFARFENEYKLFFILAAG